MQYDSIATEIANIQLENDRRREFFEGLKPLFPEGYGTQFPQRTIAYVQGLAGLSQLPQEWMQGVRVIREKCHKEYQENFRIVDANEDDDARCCRCPRFTLCCNKDQGSFQKEQEKGINSFLKNLEASLQQFVRRKKLESALKDKEEFCKRLKVALGFYFVIPSESNSIIDLDQTLQPTGSPDRFYRMIQEYAGSKDLTRIWTNELTRPIVDLIAESFANCLKDEIDIFLEEKTGEVRTIPNEVFIKFKSIVEESNRNVSIRILENAELCKSMYNYLITKLYRVRVTENALRKRNIDSNEVIVFKDENGLPYYQIKNEERQGIIKTRFSDYLRSSNSSKIYLDIYNKMVMGGQLTPTEKIEILYQTKLADLNNLVAEIMKKSHKQFLENSDTLLGKVYCSIHKEIGNVILQNGIAVPSKDVSFPGVSMLFQKLELPEAQVLRSQEEQVHQLIHILDNGNSINSETLSEKRQLLKKKEVEHAFEQVKGKAGKYKAKADLLTDFEVSPMSQFLENLSIFIQGDAKTGRIIIATWAANHLLKVYIGVAPVISLGLSLAYGASDTLLRTLQEWYLQKNAYLKVQDDFSAINIRSFSINKDYWPVRVVKQLASGFTAAFFTLPTVAIILDMIPYADWWIKACIVVPTAKAEFTSLYSYCGSYWNSWLSGAKKVSINVSKPENVSTSQKRGYLNDMYDYAINIVPDFSDYIIHKILKDTQGTD